MAMADMQNMFLDHMGPEAVQIGLHFLQHKADVFFASSDHPSMLLLQTTASFGDTFISVTSRQCKSTLFFLGGPNIATPDKKGLRVSGNLYIESRL